MAKQVARRILLVIIIFTITINILIAYFFFKVTDSSTYGILGNEDFYKDISQSIYEETSNEFTNTIQARLEEEDDLEVSSDFINDVSEIVNETLQESQLASIIADTVPNNIENILGYIKGNESEVMFYLPKDELVDFLDDYYPKLTDEVVSLVINSEICNREGECISEEQKEHLRDFIEKDLDTGIESALEEIRNNDPIFSGDNNITIEEFNEIVTAESENSESNLNDIEDAFKAVRTGYQVGVVIIVIFAIFNLILFIGIMSLGPITPLRFSRNVGLISFVSGITLLIPFGTLGVVTKSALDEARAQSTTLLEEKIMEYTAEILQNVFGLLGLIGLGMTIAGALLLFVLPEFIKHRPAAQEQKKEEPKP